MFANGWSMAVLSLSAVIYSSTAHLLDNDVIGAPDVACLAHEMSVTFQTRRPFQV